MRVYISGSITNDPNYKEKFERAQELLEQKGFIAVNPAKLPLDPEHFTHAEFMEIDKVLLGMCDAIYLLPGWKESDGALIEYKWAVAANKKVLKGREEHINGNYES